MGLTCEKCGHDGLEICSDWEQDPRYETLGRANERCKKCGHVQTQEQASTDWRTIARWKQDEVKRLRNELEELRGEAERQDCIEHGGDPLVKGVDAGGVRWYLDGEPVNAGTGLEILLALEHEFEELGALIDFKPLWVPVRLEFDFPAQKALVHWPTHGGKEFLVSECTEGVLFRWPGK